MLLTLGALAAPAVAAPNLVANGDFEMGNTDFTSDYNYVASPGAYALYPEKAYAVGTNAANYHNLWASYGDHTSGRGNYMILNGDPNAGSNVWTSNLIALAPGTYSFTAYVANSCCNGNFGGNNATPDLTFSRTDGNGMIAVALDSSTVPSPPPGQWLQRTATFTIASGTSGYLTLRNAETARSGNDFGLDDISLTRTGGVPEPTSWAMMISGFGLVGGALRRRARTSVSFA